VARDCRKLQQGSWSMEGSSTHWLKLNWAPADDVERNEGRVESREGAVKLVLVVWRSSVFNHLYKSTEYTAVMMMMMQV